MILRRQLFASRAGPKPRRLSQNYVTGFEKRSLALASSVLPYNEQDIRLIVQQEAKGHVARCHRAGG